MVRQKVLVLVGPTASGKSSVAIDISRLIPSEIISADSRQVYRFMDIGTAKPTPSERAQVPHHFVDMLDPDADFSAGEFGSLGREAIREIGRRGKTAVVVGGSGLYVRSLVDGLFEGPSATGEIRESLHHRLDTEGVEALLAELRRVDPETAAHADPTKPRRIVRALEVYYVTGMPLSRLQREKAPVIDFTPRIFGLEWPREELYRRIDRRCDAMLAAGFLDEVRSLRAAGFGRSLNALNTVGYAEAMDLLDGLIDDGEMVRRFKQNSRRYAKRQLTWFRADTRVSWVGMSSHDSAVEAARRIATAFQAP